jgi:hypothetical protein
MKHSAVKGFRTKPKGLNISGRQQRRGTELRQPCCCKTTFPCKRKNRKRNSIDGGAAYIILPEGKTAKIQIEQLSDDGCRFILQSIHTSTPKEEDSPFKIEEETIKQTTEDLFSAEAVPAEPEEYIRYLQKHAESGNAEMQFRLAWRYESALLRHRLRRSRHHSRSSPFSIRRRIIPLRLGCVHDNFHSL